MLSTKRLFRRANVVTALAAVSALGLSASPARAEFLAWGINRAPQLAGPGGLVLNMFGPNVSAQRAIDVTVPAATVLMITFSAECSVAGAGSATSADIDIQVDKEPRDGNWITVPTTDADDAFCAANGTTASDGWVTASRTVADTVPKGTSAIRVVARTAGGPGPARIDDLALLVAR
jgi:hypothetical protein